MIILSKNGSEIWIEFPSGEKSVIDSEYEWALLKYKNWKLTGSKRRYVCVYHKGNTYYLHKIIMGLNQCIDHIDRNPLNNRRSNLRPCTPSQNVANTAPRKGRRFKGVELMAYSKKKTYYAYIRPPGMGRKVRLGSFNTPEEAATVYDKAAREVWGDFAYLNFPEKLDSKT